MKNRSTRTVRSLPMIRFASLFMLITILAPTRGAADAADARPLTRCTHNDYEQNNPLRLRSIRDFAASKPTSISSTESCWSGTRGVPSPGPDSGSAVLGTVKQRIAKNWRTRLPGRTAFHALHRYQDERLRRCTSCCDGFRSVSRSRVVARFAGRFARRAVDVVISGDRPFAEIAADKDRHVGIDGRLSDWTRTSRSTCCP